MTTFKRGTRIEALLGMGVVEGAKILRPYAPDLPGFWLIRFDNGDQLGMHESGFRVIDNRKGFDDVSYAAVYPTEDA